MEVLVTTAQFYPVPVCDLAAHTFLDLHVRYLLPSAAAAVVRGDEERCPRRFPVWYSLDPALPWPSIRRMTSVSH